MKGSYVLLINLPEAQTIKTGTAEAYFPHGYYAYVGSALSGIEYRINRHLSGKKKLRWHIDYLLQKASITDIIIGETGDRVECALAGALGSQFEAIPDFGSSDCRCPGHLFFAFSRRQIKRAIKAAFRTLAIPPEEYYNDGNHAGKTWGNGMECGRDIQGQD